MYREGRRATVHGVAKNQKRLSAFTLTYMHTKTHTLSEGNLDFLGLKFIELGHQNTKLRFKKDLICCVIIVVQSLSHVQFLQPHGLEPARFLCPWAFSGQNSEMDGYFLLQRIFLTQGSNPCLQHQQADSFLGSQLQYLAGRAKVQTYILLISESLVLALNTSVHSPPPFLFLHSPLSRHPTHQPFSAAHFNFPRIFKNIDTQAPSTIIP